MAAAIGGVFDHREGYSTDIILKKQSDHRMKHHDRFDLWEIFLYGVGPHNNERNSPMALYPYADPKLKITAFRYQDWLILGRGIESLKRGDREAMYVIMKDYSVSLDIDGKLMVIVVPKGMTTDLASVPKIFRNIVGRVGPHLEACIVHDWLYIAWQLQDRQPTRDDWKFANRVLYAGLKAAGVSWVVRMAMKIAMETPRLSWSVFKGRDKNLFVELGQ